MMNEHMDVNAARTVHNQQVYQQNARDEWKDLYAGFWKRFLATCIDSFILLLVAGIMIGFVVLMLNLNGDMNTGYANEPMSTGKSVFVALFPFLLLLLELVFPWLYYSMFEHSKYHATPGKMVLGIVAVDQQYRPLSFGRASGRYWAQLLNGFTLNIGFMVAGWTTHKQALHDLVAGTYVVNKHALERLHQQQREYEQQLQEYNNQMAAQKNIL
ncbi:RDD family protein [Paenibacillus dauci]|uniref:RDD family protein n=1 Tax=Paenibacillus dauci TaxID=1567106 RepID=UPI00069850D8|nr:RDD family protein [Paenibacillus dauci]